MTDNIFTKATKEKAKLRVAIDGPAKGGKTFTALVLATAVTERFGGRIAVIDTERGSASKYADIFDFDVVEFSDFHPDQFMQAIKAATDNGYGCLIIDSLSHEWMGERGILQLVDQEQAKTKSQFAAWRVPSGLHSKLVDTMLQADIHLIATMRSKMAYEQVEVKGKLVPKKIGLEPVQRPGMEYEFDVLISIDLDHHAVVSGSRCPDMDGRSANRPDGDFFTPLLDWVSEGVEPKGIPTKSVKVAKPQPAELPAADEGLKGTAPLGETFDNMNDFYRQAVERFDRYGDKRTVAGALQGHFGKTVLALMREDGMEMPDLWQALVEIEVMPDEAA